MNLKDALRMSEKQAIMLREIGETNRMHAAVADWEDREGDLGQLGQLCTRYGAHCVHNYLDQLRGVA